MKKSLFLTVMLVVGVISGNSASITEEKWSTVNTKITPKKSDYYLTPEAWRSKTEKSLESNGFSDFLKPGKKDDKKDISWSEASADRKTTYKHTLSGLIKEPLK